MQRTKLKELQKKGATKTKINALIGALIVVVLATALAPTMFENVDNLTGATGVPSWVPTVLFVIVGAGLVFLIYDSFIK